MSRMLSAAKDDDAEEIRKLIAEGLSVDDTNQIGQAALHVAAIWGNGAAIEALLSAGASVNIANQFGVTPLHYASQNSKYETARTLLAHGASVSLAAHNGKLPSEVAKEDAMRALLGGPTLELHEPVKSRDVPKILSLIAGGVRADEMDPQNVTALHLAVAYAAAAPLSETNFSVVEALLSAKKGPAEAVFGLMGAQNTHSRAGVAPIHLAVSGGSLRLVKALLEAGAPASVKSRVEGKTSGAWLRRGPDGQPASSEHQSPLHIALDAGVVGREIDVEMVALLLRHGADPNSRDTQFCAPLHHAIDARCHEAVRLLLEAKADTAVGNGQLGMKNSCLHQAVLKADLASTQLLLQHGARVDARGRDGWTALCHAARSGYTPIVRELLGAGADASLALPSGQTALEIATVNKRDEIVRLLQPQPAGSAPPVPPAID